LEEGSPSPSLVEVPGFRFLMDKYPEINYQYESVKQKHAANRVSSSKQEIFLIKVRLLVSKNRSFDYSTSHIPIYIRLFYLFIYSEGDRAGRKSDGRIICS